MADDMSRWIESWWPEADRPDAPAAGQIWTVFHPDPRQEAPGTITALVDWHDNVARVVPLHHEPGIRTGCEPVLGPADLTFDDQLVAAVELAGDVSRDAFADARYLGQATPDAVARLRRALTEVDQIIAGLDEIRRREAELGPQGVTDEQIQRGFEAGLLKLMPMDASYIEWADLHRGLHFNLAPYAAVRRLDLSARPVPDHDRNRLSVQLDNIYHPETIYRTMNDLLEAAPPALRNHAALTPAVRAPIHPLYNQKTHKISADELCLLRALVHVRLEKYHDAEGFFRALLDSRHSDLGRRGLVWLSQNYNAGDDKSVREMAGRLAGPGRERDSEDVMRRARELPLSKFMGLDSLDREIMRLWRRAEDSPLP